MWRQSNCWSNCEQEMREKENQKQIWLLSGFFRNTLSFNRLPSDMSLNFVPASNYDSKRAYEPLSGRYAAYPAQEVGENCIFHR